MTLEESPSPIFSIIMPTYNRAYLLSDAINSVLDQSYPDFELLIIDDGSTDNTSEVVRKFNDDRIKYIYQTNQERSAARNNGIKKALGKYVCFLDSDDYYESNHLQVLFDHLSANNFPVGLFFTNCFVIANGNRTEGEYAKLKAEPISYFIQNAIVPDRVCIHKDILKEFNFRIDINISEDTVLFASIANKYPVTHIEKYTVNYRLHDDNSINIKNNCFYNRLVSLEKLFENEEIKKKAGKKVISEVKSTCYLGIARHYEYKRSFIKMLKNLFLSFVYDPFSANNKSNVYMIYKYILKK